jgi:hypothetical protein
MGDSFLLLRSVDGLVFATKTYTVQQSHMFSVHTSLSKLLFYCWFPKITRQVSDVFHNASTDTFRIEPPLGGDAPKLQMSVRVFCGDISMITTQDPC